MVNKKEKNSNSIEDNNISYEDLFKLCNFNEQELKIARELWQPNFHQMFVEIDEEKLIKWLNYKKDGFIFTNFIKLLYDKYYENTHFKILNYNGEVKIYVLGSIWRLMIINSNSQYAASTLKVYNKIETLTKEVFDILKERNLIEIFKKYKKI